MKKPIEIVASGIEAYEGPARTKSALDLHNQTDFAIPYTRENVPRKYRAALVRREMQGAIPRAALAELCSGALREVSAADSTSASIGTLSGTEVLQDVVDNFQYEIPDMRAFALNLSDKPGVLGQDLNSKIITEPMVMSFNPALNNDSGEPIGWGIQTAAQATDVSLILSKLLGVPIRFTLDVISATSLNLFDQQRIAVSGAIGRNLLELAFAQMTPANFDAYVNAAVPKIPLAYATLATTAADLSLALLEAAFDNNQVAQRGRSVFVIPSYHETLEGQVTYVAGQVEADGYEDRALLPIMYSFRPRKAANLTIANATAKLAGFAMQRSAIVLAARPPAPLDMLIAGNEKSAGRSVIVTNPETGMTMLSVESVNHEKGYAQVTAQVLIGAAPGDTRGGLCITTP